MIETILETKRQEVTAFRHRKAGVRRRPVRMPVFDAPVNIIAELKRKSPSAGFISEITPERIEIYSAYAKGISVLTDSTYFGGSYDFLSEVAGRTSLPVLCKDFIIDPLQIDMAFAAGADIVLLIARILTEENLERLYAYAGRLGMACLVELHEHKELQKLKNIDAPLIGVNARNLDTLKIDLDGAARLLSEVSAPMKVAESGIKTRRDIERMKNAGRANGFLIGETLMRSENLEATFKELLYGKDQILRHDEPR